MIREESINELIRIYNAIISALEEDIAGEKIGNGYRSGRWSAFKDVVKDLEALINEEEDIT